LYFPVKFGLKVNAGLLLEVVKLADVIAELDVVTCVEEKKSKIIEVGGT
jgi:hypothetical protein